MLKYALVTSGLLLCTAIAPSVVWAGQPIPTDGEQINAAQEIQSYSRETETCINLRGCGRRERT